MISATIKIMNIAGLCIIQLMYVSMAKNDTHFYELSGEAGHGQISSIWYVISIHEDYT